MSHHFRAFSFVDRIASVQPGVSATGFYACVALIVALEVNAVVGKMGPMASVKGVIHSSIALTAIIWLMLALL